MTQKLSEIFLRVMKKRIEQQNIFENAGFVNINVSDDYRVTVDECGCLHGNCQHIWLNR